MRRLHRALRRRVAWLRRRRDVALPTLTFEGPLVVEGILDVDGFIEVV